MAIVFGGQSRFLANKRRIFLWIGLLLLLGLFVLSFNSKIFSGLGLWGSVIFLAISYTAIKMSNIFERHYGRLDNGIFGEGVIANELKKLPDGYVVFRGLKIGEHQDIDCAVAGPNGVFAVEVKSHKGKIGYDGQRLTRNGRWFEKDFFHETMAEAVGLRALMARTAKLDIFVEPIIVFSSNAALVQLGSQKIKNCYVIGKAWLNELITSAVSERLDGPIILRIAKALTPLVDDRRKDEKLIALEKKLAPQQI